MKKYRIAVRTIIIAAACAALSACSSSQTQQAQQLWLLTKAAISTYEIATKTPAATIAKVAAAEAVIDPEVAALSSLTSPSSPAAIAADINTLLASLPAGTLSAQDAAYIALAQDLAAMAQALATPVAAPVAAATTAS